MGILAMIEVHQCDACQTVETVDRINANQEAAFDNNWSHGLTYSFCEDCKDAGYAKAKQKGEKEVLNKYGFA